MTPSANRLLWPAASTGALLVARMTTLLNAVARVIAGSTNEQMIGVHARRDVALMANQETMGNWSLEQLEGNTVGIDVLPADFESAVIVAIYATGPQPTADDGDAIDLCEESVHDRSWLWPRNQTNLPAGELRPSSRRQRAIDTLIFVSRFRRQYPAYGPRFAFFNSLSIGPPSSAEIRSGCGFGIGTEIVREPLNLVDARVGDAVLRELGKPRVVGRP